MSLLLLAAVAASEALPPICTERPGKANGVCTVPPGHVQVETGLADWSLTEARRTQAEFVSLGATFVRVGLTDGTEIQLGVSPYSWLTFKDGGSKARVKGFGDITIRYKQRLTEEEGPVQVGLIPFVKLPTAAHDLGNGKLEGGLAVPIIATLGGPVGITLGPEVDMLADANGNGHHAALVNLVNVGAPIAERLTLSGELWTNFNFDPAKTIRQASADTALAYLVSDDMQLDAGANFGLTRETPDVEIYAGVSARF
ncbi:MAG TPA: transporter [Sphingomicrobium sp.]|nr:transporter [Sphingomicrobium sp.]